MFSFVMRVQPILALLLLLPAQAREMFVLRGLAVYGGDREENFPLVINGKITIQFDVLADQPPILRARFYHCSRDWEIDQNFFVNDEARNTSGVLAFTPSPNGVRGYSYRYVNTFPDGEFVQFAYSGNWVFKIMDETLATTYAEGRFIVAEGLVQPKVTVTNEFLTTKNFPHNQVHKVVASVTLPSENEAYYVTTMDVYQNRRLYNACRIDTWDRNPYTKVEGFNTGQRIFSIRDIVPGNEYRLLDLGNPTRYPILQPARHIDGVDLPRHFWRTGSDRNGEATLNSFTGVNSDYLEFLFRLDMTTTERRTLTGSGYGIYVVGQFNFWNPTREDELVYDEAERAYVVRKLLRRGIYDYQYISGIWNPTTQSVEQQDWVALEGTDVRTTNVYTVVVYYNDPRFGGFDRIVGIGQAKSPGTATIGSN